MNLYIKQGKMNCGKYCYLRKKKYGNVDEHRQWQKRLLNYEYEVAGSIKARMKVNNSILETSKKSLAPKCRQKKM